MSTGNFKAIQPIPNVNDFIDIVLSRTQRKLPTVIRAGFKISRIRNFYARKVKFTQETIAEKLSAIIDEFPKLNDIHPFYSDLLNILYDRDHLKIALSQLSTARHLVDGVGHDYLKLLKYGDSLYRCKQLKRAALGRMATIIKRHKSVLLFLEQVRQHLSRLPTIDPNTRTLLICGYPNVGKSSFMNKITRAQVDVQSYAFTTKSLFVGHMDYKYLRWQVIDTPGILDHPLEEMNTIEMQSVAAMAHLRAAILYFLDLSEQCGYTTEAQIDLFKSIKPLFANKLVFLILNKSDQLSFKDLDEQNRNLISEVSKNEDILILEMSCLNDEGVINVKQTVCDALLASRVEHKMKGARINSILDRIHVAKPQKRDDKERPVYIPESALNRKPYDKNDPNRIKLMRDIEEENGGAGVFNINLKEQFLLENPDWKADVMPEFFQGKNVADFIDSDIETKLAELDEEEDRLEREGFYESDDEIFNEDENEILEQAQELQKKINMNIRDQRSKKTFQNRPSLPRTAGKQTLTQLKLEKEIKTKAARRIGFQIKPKKREVSVMDVDETNNQSKTRTRSQSNRREDGIQNENVKKQAEKIARFKQRKMNMTARAGESDRRIQEKKPKYLYTGKRPGFHTTRSR